MKQIYNKAMELSQEILEYPLHKCGPSDDPDKQYAYSAGFRDISLRFIRLLKRLNDPEIDKMLSEFDIDIDVHGIYDAHLLKSNLITVIDYLHEKKDNEEYFYVIKGNETFIDNEILEKICKIDNDNFDLSKLLKFLDELNFSYKAGNYLSSILLLRAIINHIPPIFGVNTFAQVVAQSGKSVKSILSRLEDDARPIADLHTHITIRRKESLPTKNQIEPYKSSLEILLQEIISKLDSK
jgi:hypothetical protein